MKKVLALSALGCLATIGAVFAAFTLDPTSESGEIPSANVDVDLSSHVFSTFERVYEIDYDDGSNTIWEHVPVGEPNYLFKPKNVVSGTTGAIVGTTLDLHCDDYDINDMALYCQKRKAEPDPKEVEAHEKWEKELAELAPTGYAFKYEYDNDFLTRIKVDDRKPDDMEDWEYAIYKTTFSSGLTKSDFKAEDLLAFGIHYQDPNATKPNYKEFIWDKTQLEKEKQYPWIEGGPGLYIQPNVTDEGKVLNSGVVFFTGAEITENLFGGQFIGEDDTAMKACAAYLNEKETGTTTKYLHRNFALKIKASEYFKVETNDLTRIDTTNFEFINPDPSTDYMLSGDRYCFNFKVDEDIDQMFKDGFELDKFAILNDMDSPVALVTGEAARESDISGLGLKVMLDSPNNGVSDITRFFKYGFDRGDTEHYATIYFDNTVAFNAVGYLPEKGDVIKINFIFRSNNGGKIEQSSWARAKLNMVKPIAKYATLSDPSSTGTYTFTAAEPISMQKDKTYRFETSVNEKRYFDTFSLTSDGVEPITLTSEIVRLYIVDSEEHLAQVRSDYYSFDKGNIVLNDEIIRQRYPFGTDSKYVIDIRHHDDTPLVVKTAKFTTTQIPREIMFISFKLNTETPIEGGMFEPESTSIEERTIESGLSINFRCNISAAGPCSDFWKCIDALVTDSSGYTAKLRLILKDTDGNVIPLDTSTFTVKRKSKDGSKIADDTEHYKYDSDTSSILTDDTAFIKTMSAKDGYNSLVINVNYNGSQVVIKELNVVLETASPTSK